MVLNNLYKRIGGLNPFGVIRQIAQKLFSGCRGFSLKRKLKPRSSGNHEPSKTIQSSYDVSKSLNSQGHFANLGTPLILTKLYKEHK